MQGVAFIGVGNIDAAHPTDILRARPALNDMDLSYSALSRRVHHHHSFLMRVRYRRLKNASFGVDMQYAPGVLLSMLNHEGIYLIPTHHRI